MQNPLVSVVISSFNYAEFLSQAIGSALAQIYPAIEVIVVDDGSTDNSRTIISRYGERITPVLKENGGMGSTINAGFEESHGEIVIFLDADDALLPSAVASIVPLFRPDVAKVHWPMVVIDEHGTDTGRIVPVHPLPDGDFRDVTIEFGPDSCISPSTSGNAWSRRVLQAILPMPAAEFRQHADTYLYTLAPLFGPIRRIPRALGLYRVHGRNDFASKPTDEQMRRLLEMFDIRASMLCQFLRARDVNGDPQSWKENNDWYVWMRDFVLTAEDIKAMVPTGSSFLLVDQGKFTSGIGGDVVGGRTSMPFLEHDGQYWGLPPDDATAVRELERMQRAGAHFVVVARPAIWCLDYYAQFGRRLASHACVLRNDRVVIYQLRDEVPARV